MPDTLLEKIVHWAAGGAATVVGGWLMTRNDPFYHPGWAQDYFGWLLLAVVVAFTAVLLSLWTRGLVIVSVLAFIGAVTFGTLYASDGFQDGYWPFLAWLLHALVAALLVGVIANLATRLIFRIKH